MESSSPFPTRANARRLVVAITGASGAPYALRFLDEAVKHYTEIYLTVSDQALQVIHLETGRQVNSHNLSAETLLGRSCPALRIVDKKDYFRSEEHTSELQSRFGISY